MSFECFRIEENKSTAWQSLISDRKSNLSIDNNGEFNRLCLNSFRKNNIKIIKNELLEKKCLSSRIVENPKITFNKSNDIIQDKKKSSNIIQEKCN